MPKTKKGRKRTPRGMFYEDVVGISQQSGTFSNIVKSTLTGLPSRMNFRPLWMEFQGSGGYVPATASLPGYFCPAACQFWFQEGPNNRSTTSGVVELSERPVKRRIYYPKSGDWYSCEAVNDVSLAGFEAICPGNPSTESTPVAYVRGHLRFRMQLQPEIYPAGCPTVRKDGFTTHLSCRSEHPSEGSSLAVEDFEKLENGPIGD